VESAGGRAGAGGAIAIGTAFGSTGAGGGAVSGFTGAGDSQPHTLHEQGESVADSVVVSQHGLPVQHDPLPQQEGTG
jgi:hypothetical protein